MAALRGDISFRYLNKGNNKITEQSYKGKVKTHKYINIQNQSTTGKLVQAFLKKWWVESDFKAPNLPLSLRLKVPAVTIRVFITILQQKQFFLVCIWFRFNFLF